MITVNGIAKAKGGLYQVKFSNQEKLVVSEDQLVRHRLLKGMTLEEDEFAEIKKSTCYDLGLQEAYRYISYQLRSEKEVGQFLKDKEIPYEASQKIINQLKELHLVDDLVFAESYVRTQMRLSDKGPRNLKQQLNKKGIAEEITLTALSLYQDEDQGAVALRTAEKALRKIHGKSFKETQQKIRQTLMQKGFEQTTIDWVMGELSLEKETAAETEALTREGDKVWRRHQRKPLRERKQKVKQSLYQKGFDLDAIQQYLEIKEVEDEE